jgi:hypothetical protein
MKKSRTKQELVLVQEETPRAEASDPSLRNFPRVYVPPRKPTKKLVRLPKEPKYDLITPVIPLGVSIEGDMLGAVGSLRFSNHDIEYMKKFLELSPQNYLCIGLNPDSLVLIVKLQEWVT